VKALWLNQAGLQYRDDLAVPEPEAGDQLVRVNTAGLCSTDIGLLNGMYDFEGIIGHEFVGVVEQGAAELVGKRVVGEINIACKVCDFCRAGIPKHCSQRRVLGIRKSHGAFAEYLCLPRENIHLVPDNLSSEQAVFVEPLAAALDVLEYIDLSGDAKVLVIGDGRMGQLIARALLTVMPSISLLGRHPSKLDRLPQGVVKFNDAKQVQNQGFDYVVECTGNSDGFAIALDKIKPRGSIILKSTYPQVFHLDAGRIVVEEIRIFGSRCGDIANALEVLAAGKIDLTNLIDAKFALQDGLQAFEWSRRKDVIKVLLYID